ncbi:MAG: threonine--tRNA ligase [Candidatus Taylorbacteria bacterium]|nr:threonine--tRNA ligase [Candidatus Taylorbacteria bacterium]
MPQQEKLSPVRHSLAHLLAAAVLEFWPDAKPTLGPAIDTGFYYDFDFKTRMDADKNADGRGYAISDKDLPRIEKKMREILKTWELFSEIEVSANEAKKVFADNVYKLELIEEIAAKGEKITLYYSGPKSGLPSKLTLLNVKGQLSNVGFIDLCRGGHAEHPSKEIMPDSFKLERTAGAYWRGEEKNKMLTRIYGLAFESKEKLEAYEKQIEEAKKRDHKKLGRELDLLTFSDLIGAGLPLWTPKGTVLRDILDDFVWQLRQKAGYERVDIPHLTKKDLYEKSGHWQKFGEELFKIKTREGHELVVKPMNCPHHVQIYARKPWSYRELPQRYASTTKVYRDEQTGELSGLSRVRAITQDDAHVFCRQAEVKKEMAKIWDIVEMFYGAVGFNLTPRLSLHDPKQMEKYLGTEAVWQRAEKELRALVKEKNTTTLEALGEAAFYGPKIDFLAKDSLGREWQVATIQLDMNMPERFLLDCTNEKGERERIVMIHAAIMGSIERYLSIIIEHFAGAFPLWLAPTQVKVIPIEEKHCKAAESAAAALSAAGLRVDLDLTDEGFGKKVRQAKQMKIPYFLIIGDKDMAAGKVTVESRDKGNLGQLDIETVTKKLAAEVQNKR